MRARHRARTGKHRKPTASANKVAKIAFTGAGFQRADHAGSGGRSAGARADFPLSAMPVKAQNIVRAGVLAFALGVGAVVANTPAVAYRRAGRHQFFWFVVSFVDIQFVIRIRGKSSSTDPSSTASSASPAGSSSGSTSGRCRVRLTPKPVRPPHRVRLRRQTHALGLCRVRAARTPALPRRAATPPHQLRRRPPKPGTSSADAAARPPRPPAADRASPAEQLAARGAHAGNRAVARNGRTGCAAG